MSPRLAVIITSYDSHAVLRRGLQSLAAQPEVAEIVVADCSPQNPAELLQAEFPEVRFLHFDSKRVVPVLRWSMLPLTSAELVGALESRCVAAPDWAARIVAAHDAAPSAPAVGGPVAPGSTSSAFELGLYFCEYGAFSPPVPEGPSAALSGANLSYKRSDLEAQQDYLDSGRWETFLHEQWLAEGREPRLCGAAIEFHNTMEPGVALRQRFHYGRGYAAERSEGEPAKRWLWAALSPLLPLLLTARMARAARSKAMTGLFLRALGWTLLLNAAWSAGELLRLRVRPRLRAEDLLVMRIGIDGGTWSNRRGYGRFLRELVAALAQVDQDNEYIIYLDSSASREERWPVRFEPRFVGTSVPVAEAARADGRRSLADMARMSIAVARERLDVFFFPTVYSYFPLIRPVRTVVGVHDTIAENHPELAFASKRNERFWRWKVGAALRQADICLTVSKHSKSSIERVYGFSSARIRVVQEAPAAIFTAAPVAREDFLLYVGGISPTKNLETLLRAFASSRAERLVLVGDYLGDRFQTCHAELIELAERLGVSEGVEFAGYVPDSELADLYRRTKLFVMPSWDEGFGLPAVEAMACGAPVLVSRGHALEEVVGRGGLLADSSSVEEFQTQIDQALTQDELRGELSRRALDRAAEFSWRRTASEVLRVLEGG